MNLALLLKQAMSESKVFSKNFYNIPEILSSINNIFLKKNKMEKKNTIFD